MLKAFTSPLVYPLYFPENNKNQYNESTKNRTINVQKPDKLITHSLFNLYLLFVHPLFTVLLSVWLYYGEHISHDVNRSIENKLQVENTLSIPYGLLIFTIAEKRKCDTIYGTTGILHDVNRWTENMDSRATIKQSNIDIKGTNSFHKPSSFHLNYCRSNY